MIDARACPSCPVRAILDAAAPGLACVAALGDHGGFCRQARDHPKAPPVLARMSAHRANRPDLFAIVDPPPEPEPGPEPAAPAGGDPPMPTPTPHRNPYLRRLDEAKSCIYAYEKKTNCGCEGDTRRCRQLGGRVVSVAQCLRCKAGHGLPYTRR